jgi:hypothetical protein
MTNSSKKTSIWRIANVAAIGSTLAISLAAGTAAESQAATTFQRQQMKQAIRNMDKKTMFGVQKDRLNGRGSSSTQGGGTSVEVPDIDYSTLSCPTKCIFSCD